MPRGTYLNNHATVTCKCGSTMFDLFRIEPDGRRVLFCRNCKRKLVIHPQPVGCVIAADRIKPFG